MTSTHRRVPGEKPPEAECELMRRIHGLTWHKRGGWYKRFEGDADRTYFGKDPADAVQRLGAEVERRRRNEPKEVRPVSLTIRDAINLFLASADREHASGNMSNEQRASYEDELARFMDQVGKATKLSAFCEMGAPERFFRPARERAVEDRGIFAAEKHVRQVRSFFEWCSDTRRFIPPAFYAREFRVPSEKEKRVEKKAQRREHGLASWSPAEIREIVEAARQTDPHFYAQVLLMLNGAMGSRDLSELDDRDIDWDRRCIGTDRSKTLVNRVVPLWDLTADAMKASRAARPQPPDPQWASRFFLTPHGRPLVTERLAPGRKNKSQMTNHRTDAVRNQFYALLNPSKEGRPTARRWKDRKPTLHHLKRHRAGGYTLRSAFITLSLGQPAELVAVIAGHKFANAITEHYVRGDLLDKLRGVVEHVRIQIWPTGA